MKRSPYIKQQNLKSDNTQNIIPFQPSPDNLIPTNQETANYTNQERVLVYIRIRPFNENEIKTNGHSTPIEVVDTTNNALSQHNKT